MPTIASLAACLFLAQGSGLPAEPLKLVGAIGLDGKPASIQPEKAKATVLLFVATECPIANRYAPEIRRIFAEYAPRGVRFHRVYLLSEKEAGEVRKHSKEYGHTMPAILDPDYALAKATGIRVTPEAVVMGADGIMRYRGRIDDQNIEHGRIRPDYRRDLRIALDEVLAGKPVSVPQTASIGCIVRTGN